jgi:histone deacetylase complex regulatory component SIN3
LKIFADYVNGGRSIEEMRNRIKELFKNEPDLVEGFENFLPRNNPEKKGLEAGGDSAQ